MSDGDQPAAGPVSQPNPRPVVLGLAGGVGSGKSAVARAFASLGCLVSDSDTEAKAQLMVPEVRDELVRWWGDRVLDDDGVIDRRAVAAIVFHEEPERKRLEALVHPRLRSARQALIERARRERSPGVIIDAPLLFEAGIHAECDAVVFVDTPRETRLARVQEHRGWDGAELDRRERAQWPLERKRAMCAFTIRNERAVEALKAEAERVLQASRAVMLGQGPG